jgi:lipid-A-disaccharide synthase-like uncharacterized protein
MLAKEGGQSTLPVIIPMVIAYWFQSLLGTSCQLLYRHADSSLVRRGGVSLSYARGR